LLLYGSQNFDDSLGTFLALFSFIGSICILLWSAWEILNPILSLPSVFLDIGSPRSRIGNNSINGTLPTQMGLMTDLVDVDFGAFWF
jgi:hypothetical protein